MTRRWPRRRDARALRWGLGAAAVYLAVTAIALRGGGIPGRVLYDGLAPPPPYRWVHPPPELAKDNQAPEAGARTIPVPPAGAPAASVSTGDGQAGVVFPQGVIAPERGERVVEVAIIPYRVEVRHAGSRTPAGLRGPLSIALRYATGATAMVRAEGATWTALPTTRYGGFLQLLVAHTQQAGIFAAVAPQNVPYVERRTGWLYLRILGAALVVGLGIRFLPQILATFRRAR